MSIYEAAETMYKFQRLDCIYGNVEYGTGFGNYIQADLLRNGKQLCEWLFFVGQ